MTIQDILDKLTSSGFGVYIGDHYSITDLITDLKEIQHEQSNPINTRTTDPDPDRVRREFCAHCGAGIGNAYRWGEGTCTYCDPDGVALNVERNKRANPTSGCGGL